VYFEILFRCGGKSLGLHGFTATLFKTTRTKLYQILPSFVENMTDNI